MKVDIVDSLHQPEYTGENRCGPCTVLNLTIATLLGSLVARRSKLGGLGAVAVSVGLIYLRGYLVPGTPTLTEEYLPPSVLRWFGKNPEPGIAAGFGGAETADESMVPRPDEGSAGFGKSTEAGGTTTNGTEPTGDERPTAANDPEAYFLERDILESCADVDDLCLTEWFETAWFEEIEPLTDSEIAPAEVVEAFGMEGDDDQFELVARNEGRFLRSEAGQFGQWPSRPALVADIAASRVLRSRTPDWKEYSPRQRGHFLNSLRIFLESCPTTDGDIHIGEEVVESCCSSHRVIAVTCEETGERLFEHRLADIGTRNGT